MYALILLIIFGGLVAGIHVSSIDQNLSLKYYLYEAQARQGADAALEICLRVASPTWPVPPQSGTVYVDFSGGPVASMALHFEIWKGAAPYDNALASVTAIVYDQQLFAVASEVARRSASNRIDIPARLFNQQWKREP